MMAQSAAAQLVISEIMADPIPGNGIPEVEYLEIYHRGNNTLQLADWVLSDLKTRGKLDSGRMHPGDYVILTSEKNQEVLHPFGRVITVKPWPALNNTGDQLLLEGPGGHDSVAYTDSWYREPGKSDGGWSLERIDLMRICSDQDNWHVSVDEAGGTPGRRNSVDARQPDIRAPEILQAILIGKNEVRVVFSEALVRESIDIDQFMLAGGPELTGIRWNTGSDTVWLSLAAPGHGNMILQAQKLTDCSGNIGHGELQVIIPGRLSGEVIRINEVLYDPYPGGTDFIELFNTRDSVYLLKHLELKGAWPEDQSGVLQLNDIILYGGQYLLLSRDPEYQYNKYGGPSEIPESVPLFNLPDAGGHLFLFADGLFQDSVLISNEFHHELLRETEGISLERTDPALPGYSAGSWLSSANGATPAAPNSQQITGDAGEGLLRVSPEVFSPESNTRNSVWIEVHLPEPGITGTLVIFNLSGIPQTTISQNEILGMRQTFRWDGTNAKGRIVPPGYYLLFAEFYGPGGFRQKVIRRIIVGW